MPLIIMVRSGLPCLTQEVMVAVIPPADAAKLVITAIWGTCSLTAKTEPGLKPNQPIQRIKQPRVAKPILCPGMALILPLMYLPVLGPSIIAPIRAAQPPTE